MSLFLKFWLPVLAWAGVIFYLSHIPGLGTGLEMDYLLRKIAHVCEYFIFTFLLYRAFKASLSLNHQFLMVYPPAIAFFYALSDEIHQMFVVNREGTWHDVLIDCIGIVGFILIRNARSRKTTRYKN